MLLEQAIERGVPAFNANRADQCAEIYVAAAEQALRAGGSKFEPLGVRQALTTAKQAMERSKDQDAAWVLRHSFDAVLESWLPQDGTDAVLVDQTPTSREVGVGVGASRGNGGGSGGSRVLLSRGEAVGVLAGDGATWVAMSDALLDTGNEARTLIAPSVARRLGLQPDPNNAVPIRGVNGVTSAYPRLRFRLRVGDVDCGVVDGAVGGSTAVLIGRDVLGPLGEMGYTVRQV